MAWASKTYTFSPSTTIKSSEVNQNFTDLINSIDLGMPSSDDGHGIIIWSGSVVNIPSGWYLCNGSNGTPDLRGRFVIGAGGSYSVNATGGSSTHNHNGYTGYYNLTTDKCEDGDDETVASNERVDHRHTISNDNHLPPYYALCYIMKS